MMMKQESTVPRRLSGPFELKVSNCRLLCFKETGANDVTEHMENHSIEDLVRLIGVDLAQMRDGACLYYPTYCLVTNLEEVLI
jgi:hypothetical protein